MQVQEELARVRTQKETLLTIGVFDGVHLGHQRLLSHLRSEAQQKNWLSGVVTFKAHPQTVLSPGSKLLCLTDLETRMNLIREVGIDVIVPLPFTSEVAELTAREFVGLLRDYLNMRGLIIGPDFALGAKREGDGAQLRLLGREMGFSVEVESPVVLDGEVISSSAIRHALADGDMGRVKKLLQRPFSLSGQVVSGDRRGAALGFPTANLDVSPQQALPTDGVYVTLARVDDEWLPSVTNIGVRPTFGGGKRLVETFLLDYGGELRGQRVTIGLIERLRDERRFDTPEELKAQMRKDAEQARAILDRGQPPGASVTGGLTG